MKFLAIAFSFIGIILSANALQSTPANAAYDGGRIIDDSVLLNSATMSASDIQNFLTGKGSGLATRTFLFDCAATDVSNTYYQNAGAPCGQTVLASQIIYYASQIYGINPQAVLSTIQKEQSLVTTTNPTTWQINQAMGYGCPTTGGCGASNFLYQIDNGTWLLRLHTERARGNMTWWFTSTSWVCGSSKNFYKPSLYPGQNVSFYDEDNVYYRTHFIANAATSSFYCYTPHAYNNPNGLYGLPKYGTTGRYYTGSYNFVSFFERWFGPTTGTPFFQLPGSPATYILGANDTYYYIEDYKTLLNYGFETAFSSRVDNMPASYVQGKINKGNLPLYARFEDNTVYTIDDGNLHPFNDAETFTSYGYTFGSEAVLPAWMKFSLVMAESAKTVLNDSSTGTIFYIENGKKRQFCSWNSFSLQGSPSYVSRPLGLSGTHFLNSLEQGQVIAYQGDIIKSTPANNYSIWNSQSLQPITPASAQNINAQTCTVTAQSTAGLALSNQVLGSLAKSSDGKQYIIDGTQKILITNTQLTNTALALSSFVSVPNEFLSRFSETSFSSLYRTQGSDAVYMIKDGKSYWIPSSDDLSALGFNFNQVIIVSSLTSSLFPANGTAYKEGRVVRIGNNSTVYLLHDNFTKEAFSSGETFVGYGYDWGDVISTTEASISGYNSAGGAKPIAIDNQNVQWIVGSQYIYSLAPELLTPQLFGSPLSTTKVSASVLNKKTAKTATKVFRAGDNAAVYLIENGKKRPFSTAASFVNKGYQWTDVMSVTPEYVTSLETGSAVN